MARLNPSTGGLRCPSCRTEKPRDAFRERVGTRHTHAYCRQCERLKSSVRYQEAKDAGKIVRVRRIGEDIARRTQREQRKRQRMKAHPETITPGKRAYLGTVLGRLVRRRSQWRKRAREATTADREAECFAAIHRLTRVIDAERDRLARTSDLYPQSWRKRREELPVRLLGWSDSRATGKEVAS